LIGKRVESPSLNPQTTNNQRLKIFQEFFNPNDNTIADLIESITEACWDEARKIEEQRLVSTHGKRHPVVRQFIKDKNALTPHDATRLIYRHIIKPIEKVMATHVTGTEVDQEMSVEIVFKQKQNVKS
jgi:hypothetical protein